MEPLPQEKQPSEPEEKEEEEEEEEEEVNLQRKQHLPEWKSWTDSDEVDILKDFQENDDVFDAVEVLRKQDTYDLICPNCSSCITKTVILRRKARKIRPEAPNYESLVLGGIEAGDVSIGATPTPVVAVAPEDKVGKLEPGTKPETAIKCLSCFSLFIPIGQGFWILRGSKKDESETSAETEAEEIAAEGPNIWNFFNICAPDDKIKLAEEKEKAQADAGDMLQVSVEPAPLETPNSQTVIADESRPLDILKSVVYGGLMESITSLGVVSSAAGCGASTVDVVALALANLITGLFVLLHNIRQLKNSDRNMNLQQDQYKEQLGRRENYPWHLTICILSYFIFGLVPPVVYGFSFNGSNDTYLKYAAVAAASFVCIVLLAVGKAYVGKQPKTYFKTVLYYVIAGVSASGASYFIGEGLEALFEKLGWFESNSALNVPILEAKTMWASI